MGELLTFGPDLNPMTPGILTAANGVYPTEAGSLMPVPGPSILSQAMAANCLGGFSYQDLSINFRTIAGTATKLYLLDADGSWDDVSRASTAYAATDRWRFAAYGNYCLATDYDDVIQVFSGSTFANLGGSPPKAKYITVSNNFVVLGYTNDGTAYPNRIQWSAQGDHTSWTPSLSTQAGYMDLVDTPGAITGIGKLGDYLVVFKKSAIYLGTYVGPPLVWAFRSIPTYGGGLSQDAIVQTPQGIYFAGENDFYLFDGAAPRSVGESIRQWWLTNMNREYSDQVLGLYDGIRKLIYWFFPSAAGGLKACTECLIFNTTTHRWGRMQLSARAAFTHWRSGVTYDSIVSFYATYDGINRTYDDPWWSSYSFGPSIIGMGNELARLEGSGVAATFTTHEIGKAGQQSQVKRVWLYFKDEPATCTVTPKGRATLGGTKTSGAAATYSNGKADMMLTNKYLSFDFSLTGDWELAAFDPEIVPKGKV